MAEVDVTIGGRTYRLACDDGQEPHLRQLSARVDAEARNFAAAGTQIPESQLLLMSALMIADKLDEAENEAALRVSAASEAQTAAGPVQNSLFSDAAISDAVSQIDAAADRVRALSAAADGMAEETQPSPGDEDDPSQFDVEPPAEASLFDIAPPEPEATGEATAETANAAVEPGAETEDEDEAAAQPTLSTRERRLRRRAARQAQMAAAAAAAKTDDPETN